MSDRQRTSGLTRDHDRASWSSHPADPDPWSGLVARYAVPRRRAGIDDLIVVTWHTRHGEQPVILLVRRRLD